MGGKSRPGGPGWTLNELETQRLTELRATARSNYARHLVGCRICAGALRRGDPLCQLGHRLQQARVAADRLLEDQLRP